MRYDVLIRLDAGGTTGLGHLRRCLALANALRGLGHTAAFLTRNPSFVREWAGIHFPVIGIQTDDMAEEIFELSEIVSRYSPRLFVIDHYEYTPPHIQSLRKNLKALAVIVDLPLWKDYPADAVINHNVDARVSDYPAGPKLFLGTKYSLMSGEVTRFRTRKKPQGFNVFMTMGGSADVKGVAKLLSAFEQVRSKVKNAKAYVAPGLGWKNSRKIPGVTWIEPRKFLQAMSKCHAAVSSSGVTSYELACMGVPAVLLTIVDNQERISKEMVRRKCALGGTWLKKTTAVKIAGDLLKLQKNPKLRRLIEKNQKKLVRTDGPLRLAKALEKEFLS